MSYCVEIKDSDYIELCYGDFFRDSERFRYILSREHSCMDAKTLLSKIRENPISDYGLEVLVGEMRGNIGDLPCEIHTLKGKRFIPQLKSFDTGDKIGFFVCFGNNHAHLIIKIGNGVFDLDSIAPDNVIKNIDDVDGLDVYTVLGEIQSDGYNCKSFTASLVDRFMMRVEKIKGENPEASDYEISELFFSYLSSFFKDKNEVVNSIARVGFECYTLKYMTLIHNEVIRWNTPEDVITLEEIVDEEILDILPPEMAILDEHSKRLASRVKSVDRDKHLGTLLEKRKKMVESKSADM